MGKKRDVLIFEPFPFLTTSFAKSLSANLCVFVCVSLCVFREVLMASSNLACLFNSTE